MNSRFARLAARTMAALAFLVALSASVARADDGVLEVRIIDVDASNFPTVVSVVSITEHGRPVANLEPSHVTVTEADEPATVQTVTLDANSAIDLALVVALDTSGSMEGESITRSVAAAAQLVTSLAEADSTGLVSFADSAQVVHPMSTDKSAVLSALTGLQAAGNTALYDAVVRSAEMAAGADASRRAVLLLTDGEDFGGLSAETRETALAKADSSGAIFYTIGVGADIDAAFLQELATRTGGQYLVAPQPSDIDGIYRALTGLLRGQYVISFESTAEHVGGSRPISMTVNVDNAEGTGTAVYALQPPPATPTPTPAPPTPTPIPPTPTPAVVATTTTEDSSGSGLVVPLLVGGGIGALVLAVTALLFIRRRRSAQPEWSGATNVDDKLKPAEATVGPEPSGYLSFALAGEHRVVPLDGQPMTIGSASSSDIVLPHSPGVGAQHARLWWRDGRLMLHHLDGGARTLVNGEAAEWVGLSFGDQVQVGDIVIDFTETRPAPGPGPQVLSTVAD